MYEWIKFLHLGAGVIWLGGMTLLVFVLRPVVVRRMAAPERLTLMSDVLSRFFRIVWFSIVLLWASGFWIFSVSDMSLAPRGWHVMLGIGVLMSAIFAHIWFSPFKRLTLSVSNSDWPSAGRALIQIHPLVLINLVLGWSAVAAVLVWR